MVCGLRFMIGGRRFCGWETAEIAFSQSRFRKLGSGIFVLRFAIELAAVVGKWDWGFSFASVFPLFPSGVFCSTRSGGFGILKADCVEQMEHGFDAHLDGKSSGREGLIFGLCGPVLRGESD